MWSLQNLFILCLLLSRLTSAAEVTHVAGYKGREVQISCPYGDGDQSDEKFLCRNDCRSDYDTVIKTTEGKKGRYSVYDDKDKRVFVVTISDLYPTDAGKYWCGVMKFLIHSYSAAVKLEVVPDSCCDRSTILQSHEKGSVSINCVYESKYRDNLKYMCRGNQRSTCLQQAVITSDSSRTGRFRLNDDKVSRKFTVTIISLTQKDSGLYLCGVHSNIGLDVFSAVELEVKALPKQPSTAAPLTTVESVQTSEKPIEVATTQNYVVFIVPPILALLLIGTCVAMVCKSKCCKVQGAGVFTAEERVFGLVELNNHQQIAQHSKQRSKQRSKHRDGKMHRKEPVYHTISETQDIYSK